MNSFSRLSNVFGSFASSSSQSEEEEKQPLILKKIRRGIEVEAIPEEIDQPVQSVLRDSRSQNDQLRSMVSSHPIRNIDLE